MYSEQLADCKNVSVPKIRSGTEPVWHLFVIECERRDELAKYLNEKGISTGLHYPKPLHLQKAFAKYHYALSNFPNAERTCARILSLPMYPELTKEQIDFVTDQVKAFYSK